MSDKPNTTTSLLTPILFGAIGGAFLLGGSLLFSELMTSGFGLGKPIATTLAILLACLMGSGACLGIHILWRSDR